MPRLKLCFVSFIEQGPLPNGIVDGCPYMVLLGGRFRHSLCHAQRPEQSIHYAVRCSLLQRHLNDLVRPSKKYFTLCCIHQHPTPAHQTKTPTFKTTRRPKTRLHHGPESHRPQGGALSKESRPAREHAYKLTSESLNCWGVKQSRVKDGRDTHATLT